MRGMPRAEFVPYPDRYVPAQPPELAAAAFHDVVRRRRSVRMFSDRPVSRATIEWLVRAAHSAPSGANKQPWRFVCVQDAAVKARIRTGAENEEREFYARRANAEWLADLAPLGTDEHKPWEMARVMGDFGEVLAGVARGELAVGKLAWDARVAVCVVVAAAGYPANVRTGDVIGGLDAVPDEVVVFHAGTARKDAQLVSNGGRVLGVTALGVSVEQARERAYGVVDAIQLDGKQVRRDIGARR